MTVISKIEPALAVEPFERAIREVNEWRGRCLHIFANAEFAVTECLEVLSQVPGRGSNVGRRHLIGQRYEDLSKALSLGGPFEAENGKTLEALTAFRNSDHLRAMLCHGASEVLLDSHGRWVAIFRCLSFKGRQMQCDELVVRSHQAENRQKELSRDATRLRALLAQLSDKARPENSK